jgi:hypothetical protein
MVKFPTLIEFIDEVGLDELHATHKDYMEDMDENDTSFDTFVKQHYKCLKESWEDDIRYGKKEIFVPFDDVNDIVLETAKMVMKAIIDKGLKDGLVAKTICEEDLVPEYCLVYPVLGEFYDKVVPAVEKALNEMKG